MANLYAGLLYTNFIHKFVLRRLKWIHWVEKPEVLRLELEPPLLALSFSFVYRNIDG